MQSGNKTGCKTSNMNVKRSPVVACVCIALKLFACIRMFGLHCMLNGHIFNHLLRLGRQMCDFIKLCDKAVETQLPDEENECELPRSLSSFTLTQLIFLLLVKNMT